MTPGNLIRKGYHDLLRREILELVPSKATQILDLGCGTGRLGVALKERQKCSVEGIEINKEASQEAKKCLDQVWTDNLNRFDPSFLSHKYDCLILADILEHLIAPWEVLKKFATVLADNGVVIASIPNIAHPSVILQLQKGLFHYKTAGILDVTHLRFFTKTTIFQLFYKAGLKIIKFRPWPSPENPIQYHISAIKPPIPFKDPQTTILIPTFNCWRYTLQCIASIKGKTIAPHKILVIDNGSTDETVSRIREDIQIYHIENSCNLGFGRGLNIGLQCIDTPYFVICGSDTVVTRDWLSRMIQHINTNDKLMILGPVTNYAGGPQLVKNIKYNNMGTLDEAAEERSKLVPQALTYFPRIVFFFTLFKSGVLQKVGLIDERFELGNYEDDDYCLRVRLNGLKTAIDNTVFIHHYGSQTFRENELNFRLSMETNKKKFMEKWHLTDINDYYKGLRT